MFEETAVFNVRAISNSTEFVYSSRYLMILTNTLSFYGPLRDVGVEITTSTDTYQG